MNNLGQLAMEVLDLILDSITSQSDLYHCALINKRFCTASMSRLWREPCKASQDGSRCKAALVLKGILLDIQHRLHHIPLGHHIRKLEFKHGLMEIRCIFPLFAYTPLLEDLSLEYQDTHIGLEEIGQLCPNIRRLKLSGYIKTTDVSIISFVRLFPQLRDLDLESCRHLSPLSLQPLKNCPLESLAIKSCPRLKGDWIASQLCQFSLLTRLQLQYGINNSFFRQLLPTKDDANDYTPLPRLTDLDFHLTRGIDIDTTILTTFFETHPRIQILTLHANYLDEAMFVNICNCLPRTLDLRLVFGGTVSSLALSRLINNCTGLSQVDLICCRVQRHPLQLFEDWPRKLYQKEMDLIRLGTHEESSTGIRICGAWNT